KVAMLLKQSPRYLLSLFHIVPIMGQKVLSCPIYTLSSHTVNHIKPYLLIYRVSSSFPPSNLRYIFYSVPFLSTPFLFSISKPMLKFLNIFCILFETTSNDSFIFTKSIYLVIFLHFYLFSYCWMFIIFW